MYLKKIKYIVPFIAALLLAGQSFAQCDTIASICSKHFEKNYISDGQQYRSLLLNDQTAEFHVTLYGGSTYRIAACSGTTDGNLVFSIYDTDTPQRNLLFSNKEFKTAPYWDFKITSTIDCVIEATLGDNQASGCAVVLIGFKQ